VGFRTRHPAAFVAIGVVLVVGLSLFLLPGQHRPPRDGSSTSSSEAPIVHASGPRQTTTVTVSLSDSTRPLVVHGQQLSPTRSLPTTVVMPTQGRWPLVVFVHGYDVGPSTYARFLGALAAQGYVVAAPSFPLEDPARGYGLDESDLPNEAADVSAVISELSSGPLAAHLVLGAVAVVGHSDGADVALMVGYRSGLADHRVRAIVAAAPDPISWAAQAGGPPLLLLHGSADEVVNPSASAAVFAALSSARWSLTLAGADHASDIIGPSPWTQSFDASVGDFLASSLGAGGLGSLSSELSGLAGSSLESAPGP
jgi:pimeloyl-ACP methyl ester carboxylesterase